MKTFEAEVSYGYREDDQFVMGGFTCQIEASSVEEARLMIKAEQKGAEIKSITEVPEVT